MMSTETGSGVMDIGTYEVLEADYWDRSVVVDALAGGRPVKFSGADLSNLDLSRLNFTGVYFDRCILIETDFNNSALDSTTWKSCRAGMAVFRGTATTEAKFSGCDLNNTKWARAKLSHTSFSACKLSGADMTDISSMGLSFKDTILRNAFLCGISFLKEKLEGVDLTEADLEGCDFRYAVFDEQCSLVNARITGARFESADLRGADMAGIRMSDPRQFKNAAVSPSQAAQLIRGLGLRVSL